MFILFIGSQVKLDSNPEKYVLRCGPRMANNMRTPEHYSHRMNMPEHSSIMQINPSLPKNETKHSSFQATQNEMERERDEIWTQK